MLNIFGVPISDLCIFFDEMIIQTIAHFGGIDLFLLLLLSCRNYFYILDSKLLSYMYMICKYFILLCMLSFLFLDSLLWWTNIFNFNKF